LNVPKAWLKIVLKDSEGKALANQPYTLTVAWLTFRGNTDGSGALHQKIPIGVDTGELSLDKINLNWNLKIGHLDPVRDEGEDSAIISGLQARLNNLGYHSGNVDGILGPRTREAIQAFQMKALGRDESRATGEPDKQTVDALKQQHGS
jgi:putative peptidoglycan binding protein